MADASGEHGRGEPATGEARADAAESLAERVRRLEPHALNFAYRMTGDASFAEAQCVTMIAQAIASLDLHPSLEGAFAVFRGPVAARCTEDAGHDVRATGPVADEGAPSAPAADGATATDDEAARWLAALPWPTRERVVLRLYHRLDPGLVARITGAPSADDIRREVLSALGGLPLETVCPGCAEPREGLVERLAGEMAEERARAIDRRCETCPEHHALRGSLARRLAGLASYRGLGGSPERRARVLALVASRRAVLAPIAPSRAARRSPLVLVTAAAVAIALAALTVERALDPDRSPPIEPPRVTEPTRTAAEPGPLLDPPDRPSTPRAAPAALLDLLARTYPARRCLELDPAKPAWDPASREQVQALRASGAEGRAVLEAAVVDPERGPVAVLVLASLGDAPASELAEVARRSDAAADAVRVALRGAQAAGGAEALLLEVARSAARPTAVRVEAGRLLADSGGSIEALLAVATGLEPAPADLATWRDALGGEAAAWLGAADLVLADPAAAVSRRLAAARLLAWAGRPDASAQAISGDGDAAFRSRLLHEHVARTGAAALDLVLALADKDAEARVRVRALVAVGVLAPGLAPERRDLARHALLEVATRAATESEAAAAFVALRAAGHPASELALELERAVEEDGTDARRRGAMRAIAALGLEDLAVVVEGVARGKDGPDRDRALVALGRVGGTSEVLAELARSERRGGPVPAAVLGRHLAGSAIARAGLDAAIERRAVALALDDPLDALDLARPTLGGLVEWLATSWHIELILGQRDPSTPLVEPSAPSTARSLVEATTARPLAVASRGRVVIE